MVEPLWMRLKVLRRLANVGLLFHECGMLHGEWIGHERRRRIRIVVDVVVHDSRGEK